MSKRSLTNQHVVRKRLADGTIKTYSYERRRPAQTSLSARFGPNSMAALLESYRRSPGWLATASTTKKTRNSYLKDLELLASVPIETITRRELLEIRNAIASTRGNGAGQGFMVAAKIVFAWAVANDWIELSPTRGIKSLPKGELKAWSMEQAQIAMAKLPEVYRRIVVLAIYTGQRRGDLCAMRWSDYDGQTIRVRQQKTGAELSIPVHPNLKRELDEWKRVVPIHGHILSAEKGDKWAAQHMSRIFPAALQLVGLPPDLNVHGLRKLAAANLAESGCSAHQIASVTGHKTLSMVQHYTKTVDQSRLAESAIALLKVSISLS